MLGSLEAMHSSSFGSHVDTLKYTVVLLRTRMQTIYFLLCGAARHAAAEPPASPSDVRAELLLDVMLGSLEAVAPPSLGHLLLGFDTTAVPGDWSR
jgi:hypothetical protein